MAVGRNEWYLPQNLGKQLKVDQKIKVKEFFED
jgi:hypothetical protein